MAAKTLRKNSLLGGLGLYFLQLYKVMVADELDVVLVKCLIDIGIFHNEVFPVSSFPSCGDRFHFVGVECGMDIGFTDSVGNIGEIRDEIVLKFLVGIAAFNAFGENKIIGHRDVIYLAEQT